MSKENDKSPVRNEDPVYDLYIDLLRAASNLQGQVARQLKPVKISPEQYHLIRLVSRNGGEITVGAIRPYMPDSNSNVSRLIEKLAKKGLMRKLVDRRDRRRAILKITPKGERLLAKVNPSLEDAWNELRTISDDDSLLFKDALKSTSETFKPDRS